MWLQSHTEFAVRFGRTEVNQETTVRGAMRLGASCLSA